MFTLGFKYPVCQECNSAILFPTEKMVVFEQGEDNLTPSMKRADKRLYNQIKHSDGNLLGEAPGTGAKCAEKASGQNT